MDRLLTRGDLKVDAFAIPMRFSFLILYNANIPAHLCQDQETKRAAVERVRNMIQLDFANSQVYFQTTASYYLKHKVTGVEKFWSGSFYARGQSPAVLSDFQLFDPTTFVNIILESSEDVEDRLRWRGSQTVWTFSRLESIIVNCEAKVGPSHSIFARRNLNNGGAKNRVTFAVE